MLGSSTIQWIILLCTVINIICANAASQAELSALSDLAQSLNISQWNFSSDPCTASWDGVVCDEMGTNILELQLGEKGFAGSIPTSISNLTSLTKLELWGNYLVGTIPPSIGKITTLENLNLGGNSLTGSIPPELSQLTNLKVIHLDHNNFTGSIPAFLGNLSNLTDISFQLNNFEGSMPESLGNLSQLSYLKLNANNLSGPIPRSLGNLQQLTELKLSNNHLTGGITFLEGLKNLSKLWLQRNKLDGALPDSSFSQLTELDLGFNQFSGTIPSSLIVSALQIIILCHNNLNGTIPNTVQSLTSLQILDISHNSLTGSVDSIIELKASIPTARINYHFNFFKNQTNSELDCTVPQNSSATLGGCFPATLPMKNSGFYINAGGSAAVYEDKHFAADANYSDSAGISSAGMWVVETSGQKGGTYAGGTPVTPTGSANYHVINITGLQEPFTSMRWSSSYIAFHGTQLLAGSYNVTLYFAEIIYLWNLRSFDVIVQQNLVIKDLNIYKEVGYASPYVFSTQTNVTNGTLSIEFICNLGNYNYEIGTGPMISAISVAPLFTSSVQRSARKTKRLLAITLPAASGGLIIIFLLLGLIFWHRKRASKSSAVVSIETESQMFKSFLLSQITAIKAFKIGPNVYTYKELLKATNGFDEKLLLGSGAYGVVYKGTLKSGTVVAIKSLRKQTEENRETFRKELAILSKLQHKNLVGIKGYCITSSASLLVYDYMEMGCLQSLLFSHKAPFLDWETRQKIAVDAACGLAYLHDESKYHVIHRDIKPANILLDAQFHAYVADFGLAALFKDKVNKVSNIVTGTVGYIAPEYMKDSKLSEKVDVYSFGMVLMVLLSGLSPQDLMVNSDCPQEEYNDDQLIEMVDGRLEGTYRKEEVLAMARTAVLCMQRDPEARPSMRSVWLVLRDLHCWEQYAPTQYKNLQSDGVDLLHVFAS